MKVLVSIVTAAFVFTACSDSSNSVQNNAVPPIEIKATPDSSPRPDLPTTAPADSMYTDLDGTKCKELSLDDNDSGAIFKGECPGVAGYKVILLASDHSQLLRLIDPKEKSTDVSIRDALNTAADFSLGEKIEWRMDGKGPDAKPKAIIVRANKVTDPEKPDKRESNLIVVKLTGEAPCVTNVVKPSGPDQNLRARELADKAKDSTCIKSKP